MRKIKVLIIDDSALARQSLQKILLTDSKIEVTATASDPIFAAKKITHNPPDVITLDLEMPRMNGLTFLEKLMKEFPVPVVVISSLSTEGSEMSLKALEYGAVDIIAKPQLANREFYEESRIRICDAVKAAAIAKISPLYVKPFNKVEPKLSADSILLLKHENVKIRETTDKVIVVGASTGGTNAIQTLLENMPIDCPGIVIVQHMPEHFTKTFADRLNKVCRITVKEGIDGDVVTSGKAIIAPGNKHTLINLNGARYRIRVVEGPLVNRHRPSVDVLFRSAAKYAGTNATGIILTGMGDDGAKGLLEMKNAGGYTIAQDEDSCIVFGMPKKAIELDAAAITLPLERISEYTYNKVYSK